jgi:hypothetical protein
MDRKEAEETLLRLLREVSGDAGRSAMAGPLSARPEQDVAQLLEPGAVKAAQPAKQQPVQFVQSMLATQAQARSTSTQASNTAAQASTSTSSWLSRLPVLSGLPIASSVAGGGTGTSVVSKALGSGFALSPIIGGLLSLFGGGHDETPPPLVRFALPPSVHLEAGMTQSNRNDIYRVGYGQGGAPRIADRPAAVNAPQVTVQVQTMGSRSFLDHSEEIARAVREALLNSNSLSDVLAEL